MSARVSALCLSLLAGSLITSMTGIMGGSASAQKLADPKQHLKYQRCIQLSKSDPDAAFDMAIAWQDFGGGDAASHCVAAALIGLKIYNESALRFETLAQSSKNEAAVRANILSQAAQAWLLDGNLNRAESVLNAALAIQTNDPNLLVDRAVVYADMKKYAEAIQRPQPRHQR